MKTVRLSARDHMEVSRATIRHYLNLMDGHFYRQEQAAKVHAAASGDNTQAFLTFKRQQGYAKNVRSGIRYMLEQLSHTGPLQDCIETATLETVGGQ